MPNSDLAIVVLAAGKGTRLKSGLAKVLHRAGGRTLVEHVVRACRALAAKKTCVVVGYQADDVASAVSTLDVETVLQDPQRGTGHAMLVARRAIGKVKLALVLPGDAPLIHTETLKALVQAHRAGNAAATLLTAVLDNPSGYGRVLRKSATTVAAIVEGLLPNYAEAQQVPKDDKRLKTEYATVPSPQGNGSIKGYLARPASASGKLPGILVIHIERAESRAAAGDGPRAVVGGARRCPE